MKPAPKRRRKLGRPKTAPFIRKTNTRGLAVTPQFRRFLEKNRGSIRNFFSALNSHRKELEADKTVEVQGMEITRVHPEDAYHTQEAYQVRVGGKKLFVKRGMDEQVKAFGGVGLAQEWLKGKKNTLYGIRIKIVPHHLAYDSRSKDRLTREKNYLVTDWLPEGALSWNELIKEIKDHALFASLEHVMRELNRNVYPHWDAKRNSFFYPRSRTLHLIDLAQHGYY